MGHGAPEAGIENGPYDGGIAQLLLFLDFVASGDTGGMVVGNVLVALLNRGNHVPLLDLHVVDVVEQAKLWRAHPFNQFDAPVGAVTHIVRVVSFRIE